jgi:NADPH2:quinone reductase
VTAFAALFGRGNLAIPFPGRNENKDFDYAAQTLVIIGGGSNVGRLTVQFAKMVGIGRIIAIASIRGEEELKKLGATHVIDRYSKDIPSEVYAAA